MTSSRLDPSPPIRRPGARTLVAALAVATACSALAPGTALAQEAAREAGPTAAQAVPRGQPGVLVSAGWLTRHADDQDLAILYVGLDRDRAPSEAIPGARWLDYHAIAVERDGLRTELAPVGDLVEIFRAVGVSDDTRVVVYADRGHVAARTFMTLDYLGHGDRTSVLDGGMAAWKAAGGEVATGFTEGPAGSFTADPREDMLVSADWIRERLDDPSVTLIDARPEGEYTGEREIRGLRGGHIPGAYNLYWEDLTASSELPVLRDLEEVKARFREAGASEDGVVVSYCLIGMRASYTYLVSRHLGFDARFYDPSWNEWGASAELPVVVGPRRR